MVVQKRRSLIGQIVRGKGGIDQAVLAEKRRVGWISDAERELFMQFVNVRSWLIDAGVSSNGFALGLYVK
jgi:hypothetical protein